MAPFIPAESIEVFLCGLALLNKQITLFKYNGDRQTESLVQELLPTVKKTVMIHHKKLPPPDRIKLRNKLFNFGEKTQVRIIAKALESYCPTSIGRIPQKVKDQFQQKRDRSVPCAPSSSIKECSIT